MTIQPLSLYGAFHGPNPWKVVVMLHELELPFKTTYIGQGEVKSAPYTLINPNGRVPALEDPNTGITIWESGAIIEYLFETYDSEQGLSHSTGPNKWLERQYLYFQVSGQGPYFGQYMWFARFHHETLPSAQERYLKEMKRIIGVLDTILQGKTFLVGEKCTYADLSFVTWGLLGNDALEASGFTLEREAPHYAAWFKRLQDRPAVKKMLEERAAVQAH